MKKFLLGCAAVAVSAGAAFATDLPARAPVYKAAPAAFNWSGFYVGGHAGYGFGDFDSSDAFIPPAVGSLKPTGWFGGVQVGYNNQFAPHWLLGAEIDFSAADLKDTGTTTGSVTPAKVKVDYLGTARTRFGYVVDRSLLYVTGGAAWTHDKFTEGTFWNDPAYRVGWTLGAGYEYAIDSRWSTKIEYLYADLGHYRSYVNGAALRTSELTTNLIRVGLNYRFDGSDPDRASPRMPTKAAAARYPWTGGYVGVNGMYASADVKSFDAFFAPGQRSKGSPDGGFAGIQGGYNWQVAANWLLGFETDNSFGKIKDDSATVPSDTAVHFKVDDIGTIRGRLGVVADRTLIYGTGGLAYAHVNFIENGAGGIGMGLDAYRVGWTIGGGIEYALDPNWTAKVEYLYADLGTQHLNDANGNPRSVDMTMNTVKLGVNYRGPLLERFFGGN